MNKFQNFVKSWILVGHIRAFGGKLKPYYFGFANNFKPKKYKFDSPGATGWFGEPFLVLASTKFCQNTLGSGQYAQHTLIWTKALYI